MCVSIYLFVALGLVTLASLISLFVALRAGIEAAEENEIETGLCRTSEATEVYHGRSTEEVPKD
jgi:hypothetical protein